MITRDETEETEREDHSTGKRGLEVTEEPDQRGKRELGGD